MKQITVNSIEMHVSDRGAGEPILFVHGFPLNQTMWQVQLDDLQHDYRVIAPDLRGFGRSGITEGTVTMDQFADDMGALLDELDIREPVTFCGLSMGGYVAWSFVRRHVNRLRSLILCDTRAVADTPEVIRGRRELADNVMTWGAEFAARAMLPKLFAQGTHERRPDIVAAVRSSILATDPRGIAAASRGMAERADSAGLLDGIRVPALLVVGQEDRISSVEEMRGMAEQIANAELVAVPEAGHLAPLENAAAVNAAMRRFLSRVQGA